MTADRPIRVSFLGDTLIGGEAQDVLEREGYDYAFGGIRHLLDDSDLVVANLEGPVTERAEPGAKHDIGRKRYWYRAHPDSLDAMRRAGIRVVSLANNHVLDYGPEGLLDTIDALDARGFEHCGAGRNRAAARRPVQVEVRGLTFSFSSAMQRYDIYVAEQVYAGRDRPGPARLSPQRLSQDLKRGESHRGVRVVLAHWGRNYRPVNGRQIRLASGIVDAGADLIVGHHPHVPQPLRLVRGVPVAYSLGNGLLGTPGRYHSGRPPYGLVLTVDFGVDGSVLALEVVPIKVDNSLVNFRPVVADGAEVGPLLRDLLDPELVWGEHGGGLRAEVPAQSAVEVLALDDAGESIEP